MRRWARYNQNMVEKPKDDTAGPIIGWSLGTGLKQRPIEELVEFPCTYTFKVVGEAQEGFVDSLLERVAEVLGSKIAPDQHAVRESENGRYQSVTMHVFVVSGKQVYEIYDVIKADKRVRYML